MKAFFIISGIVLWSLSLTFILCVLYDDIKCRIKMHRFYKKALQELDEEEKEIMDKLNENSYERNESNNKWR